jgi:hypothetical protein
MLVVCTYKVVTHTSCLYVKLSVCGWRYVCFYFFKFICGLVWCLMYICLCDVCLGFAFLWSGFMYLWWCGVFLWMVRRLYVLVGVLCVTGFIRGILREVRYAKSLRVLFSHRRSPSWTTLVLYSRVVFFFNEPTMCLYLWLCGVCLYM